MLGSPLKAAVFGAAFTAFVSTVDAIPKISRSGRYLYDESGSRFYIKGIAYQEQGEVVQSEDNPFGEPSSFVDPLALPDACNRDVPILKDAGINTLRVYSVNSSLNHDACMSAFSNAGIYTIIDLATPLNGSIDRLSPSWHTGILDSYLKTIDSFSKYDNVLAYNVGNEVVVDNGTAVAPYVKSAARDIKAYLNSKSSSALVGYAAINGRSAFRDGLANYLSCDPAGGNSGGSAIDLYGLNDYSWCGDSSFESSYAGTHREFQSYNVVAYLSEFGCITSPPRLWTEVDAIFSQNMADVWSGAIAFSYFPAQSVQGQFGMVTVSQDGKTVAASDDFNRLKSHYTQVSPPNEPSKGSSSDSYPNCPPSSSDFVASTKIPPTPNESACNCLQSSLSCTFAPKTANYSSVVGELLDVSCSLVGGKGGSCQDIGGDGQAGTYGRLSGCDPTVKLSYVMSQYYQLENRNPAACDFAGNATLNPNAPSSASAANAAASSCVSSPDATFVPSAPASAGSGSSNPNSTPSGGSNTGNNNNPNGAVNLIGDNNALVGMTVMALVSIASAAWTLA